MELSFAFPWAFLGLLLWFVLPRGAGWPWRFAASVLLVTALAQPSVAIFRQNVVLLVEASDRVGGEGVAAAQALEEQSFGDNPTVLFSGDTATVESLNELSPAFLRSLRPAATDIARALQLAQAQDAGRALLVSSGIETVGDALAALPDMPVDVYPLTPLANARLVNLIVPDEASPGETVQAVAIVESDVEAEMILRPEVGGETLEPIRQRIPAGRTPVSFTFQVSETGDLSVTASLEVDFEQPGGDDALTTALAVTESPAVLVINDPAMARLLAVQGFRVVEGSPEHVSAPLPYAAVVIREHADAFSTGQLAFLESFVRGGGGLMMTGGNSSFGLGGWYRTPVEEVLPVESALQLEEMIPQVAVVMVLDRSGSMRAENPSRISLARQGAIELVELAYQDDLIGLVVFDHQYEWIFRPRAATERGKREMIELISRVQPEGGTIIGPAYQEALDVLRETEAAVKHIIILSDGEFFDGTGRQGPTSMGSRPDFETMAAEGLADGITTTTIGIGEADFNVVERIARAGGGRFYGVRDTRTLPQIFTSEAITTVRSSVREMNAPPALLPHPFTAGLSDPPVLAAYVASTLKHEAEGLLEGLNGEPVLALNRYGLGRSAALTTDLNAWAGDLAAWNELPGLIGTTVRWLQAEPQPYTVTLSSEGSRLRVVVDAVRDGQYLNQERLEARYAGARTPLRQTGPGRYEAVLPSGAEGGSVVIASGGEIVARRAVSGFQATADPEAARALLMEIARRSGGQVIESLAAYDPPPSVTRASLWPWLALAGLVIFLLELILRRFSLWQVQRLRAPPAAVGRPLSR